MQLYKQGERKRDWVSFLPIQLLRGCKVPGDSRTSDRRRIRNAGNPMGRLLNNIREGI